MQGGLMRKVYVDSTVISYLAARPSRDLILAAHQQVTHDWWHRCGVEFQPYISELIVREISAGDPVAAHERLDLVATIPVLSTTAEAVALAGELIAAGALPPRAADDAMHVAIAAVSGLDYLATWNLKHMANPVTLPTIVA